VEAGFDVDRFWVGRTGVTNRKPFIVQDSSVFIDSAFIGTASIDHLKLAGGATSVSNVVSFAGSNLNGALIGSTTLSLPIDGVIAVTGSWGISAPHEFYSSTAKYSFSGNITIRLWKNGTLIGSKRCDASVVNGPWVGFMQAYGSAVGSFFGVLSFSQAVTATSSDVFTVQIIGDTGTTSTTSLSTTNGLIFNGTAVVQGFYR